MKKEQIYVKIDSEEKRLRAIEILEKAGEDIFFTLREEYDNKMFLLFDTIIISWVCIYSVLNMEEITLDQLEELLLPNYQVKDVILSLDELKAQAEKLGFDLVEKPCEPYEPKVGDFGYFWDFDKSYKNLGYISEIKSNHYKFVNNYETSFIHFRKLTESEKQEIQEAW